MSGKSFVRTLQIAVWSAPGACAGATNWWRSGLGNLDNLYHVIPWYSIRDTHLAKPVVIIEVLVIEPWAVARFPRRRTNHTELGRTTTCHVVAALLQLYHSSAVVASLPPLILGHLNETVRLLVPGALSSRMELAVAEDAHLCVASTTAGILPTVRKIHTDLCWLDPFTASLAGAVETVLRCVFLVFLVPESLKLVVEQPVYVFQGYMLGGAASRGHMLRVVDRESELAFEAGMTHTVATA